MVKRAETRDVRISPRPSVLNNKCPTFFLTVFLNCGEFKTPFNSQDQIFLPEYLLVYCFSLRVLLLYLGV